MDTAKANAILLQLIRDAGETPIVTQASQLIELHGARADTEDRYGFTAIDWAAANNNAQTLPYLTQSLTNSGQADAGRLRALFNHALTLVDNRTRTAKILYDALGRLYFTRGVQNRPARTVESWPTDPRRTYSF